MTVLLRQIRHELVAISRTPITLVLCLGLPVGFFVLLSALIGNEVLDEAQGLRLVQFFAPGSATFGIAMATFSFLAIAFAEARSTGVLKRQAGSPVPGWVLVGGRLGASLVLGLVSTVLILGSGVAFYGLVIPSRSIAAVLVTLVVSSLAFSALGLALAMLLPNVQTTVAVTNGVVVPLSFISDVFMVGGAMPGWLAGFGWLFPLKHIASLLRDALNPYLTGSGFQLDHLAVIVAWGVVGAVASVVLVRRQREGAAARPSSTKAHATAGDAVPRRTGAPAWLALVLSEVRHTQTSLWRDWSAVFFAIAFPVVLVAVIPSVNGGGDQLLANGQPLGTFYAATMAVYGAAVTAYGNMPQTLAEDRERGVLKRVRATPLPESALIVGRIVGALVIVLITALMVVAVAAALYRPALPRGLAAAVVTLVVATVCFAVLGIAVTTFVRSAQAVIGVTLGTMLPLAFISDIFVVGATLPSALDLLSWIFPLRHASSAMTQAVAPDLVGSGLAWGHLGALLAWTAVGAVVVALHFRWEAVDSSRHTARATRVEPVAAR